MKNTFILLLSLLLFSTCKKDAADIDPCANITCVNGDCVNGDCDCPPEFDGPDCSNQVTPHKIIVSKVVVKGMPTLDVNGATWDLGSGPDLKVTIVKSGTVLYTSNVIENADTANDATFNFTFDFEDPQDTYAIHLYDHDTGLAAPDDFMGGFTMTPYGSNTNGFPSTLIIGTSTSDLSFTLTVSYQW